MLFERRSASRPHARTPTHSLQIRHKSAGSNHSATDIMSITYVGYGRHNGQLGLAKNPLQYRIFSRAEQRPIGVHSLIGEYSVSL